VKAFVIFCLALRKTQIWPEALAAGPGVKIWGNSGDISTQFCPGLTAILVYSPTRM